MSTETSTFAFQAVGTQRAAAQIRGLGGSMGQLNQQAQSLQPRFTGLAGASGALGSAVGAINPELGRMASVVGSAGGAVSGLTAAIGGVGGLVGGGLVAALGIAVTWLANMSDEAEQAEEELKKADAAATDFSKTLSRISEQEASAARESALRLGVGELAEQRAKVEQLRQQIAINERKRQEALEEGEFSLAAAMRDTTAQLRSQLNTYRDIAEAAQEAANAERMRDFSAMGLVDESGRTVSKPASDLDILGDPKSKGGRKSRGSSAAGIAAFTEQQSLLDQAMKESEQREALLTRIAETEAEKRTRAVRQASEAQQDAETERVQNMLEGFQAQESAYREMSARVQAENDMLRQSGMSAWMSIGSVASSVLQDIASGQDVMVSEVLRALGSIMISEGTRWLFTAAAQAFIPGLQGNAAGLFAVGLAEIAAGAALGGLAAATAPPSGAASSAASPSRPTSGQTGSGSEGAPTYVVQINTLYADETVSERVVHGLRALKRTKGSQAVQV